MQGKYYIPDIAEILLRKRGLIPPYPMRTGSLPENWPLKVRCALACSYLSENKSDLDEIAELCFFESREQLAEAFSLLMKVSPEDYRRITSPRGERSSC